MNVRIEKLGRVTTVILDRPGKRNAVDRPTARALAMGLANRVVADGTARAAAEALANEFAHGLKTLECGEWLAGAARFTKGEGKHGAF